jgi:glycogen operon protein
MLLAGDEIGRTQSGNNNAYCQDNELSWLDWERADLDLAAFVAALVRFRRELGSFAGGEWSLMPDTGDSRAVVASYRAGTRQVLVGFNPTDADIRFDPPQPDQPWFKVVDTTLTSQPNENDAPLAEKTLTFAPHSLTVLARFE